MKVRVPLDASQITLEQYQRYIQILDDSDAEFVGHKKLSIFLGVEMKDVLSIPQSQAEGLIKDIDDMLDEVPAMEYVFEHDGVSYGFIPDLEALTLGEYVDLEEYIQNPKDWHKAAAVLFRPIRKRVGDMYSIDPYIGDSASHSTAKSMPANQFINATLFFYRLSSHLSISSRSFLVKVLEKLDKSKLTTQLRDSLENVGDGSMQYTSWATEMRRSLSKLLS